jgi:hypothetical protein
MYLSERIGEQYQYWGDRKILINSGTGDGKTYFLQHLYAPYLKSIGKKMLICCNRRLLRRQYDYEFARTYDFYRDYDNVTVTTYQRLAQEVSQGVNLRKRYEAYDVLVLDECHVFIADSSFNGLLYVLWDELTKVFAYKQIVFISATIQFIRPHIEAFCERIKKENSSRGTSFQIVDDYDQQTDSSYFKPIVVDDLDSLVSLLALEDGQTLVFIDDKTAAQTIKQKLQHLGIADKEIGLLNADILESEEKNRIVEDLVCAQKISRELKVLLTTSCLDNGVSITDPNTTGIAVMASDQVSFVQMAGRIRVPKDYDRQIKLYLVKNPGIDYWARERNLEWQLQYVEKHLVDSDINVNLGWSRDNKVSSLIRQVCVMRKTRTATIVPGKKAIFNTWEIGVNEFAIQKMRQDYHNACRFYAGTVDKNSDFIEKTQLGWLGIQTVPASIKVENPFEDYNAHKKRELREFILEVANAPVDSEQWPKIKQRIGEKIWELELYRETLKRGDKGIGNKKFEQICEDLRLEIVDGIIPNSSRKSYCVRELRATRGVEND